MVGYNVIKYLLNLILNEMFLLNIIVIHMYRNIHTHYENLTKSNISKEEYKDYLIILLSGINHYYLKLSFLFPWFV